jgi:hypothetical protein
MQTLDAVIEKFDSNLWHYHIPIPDDIADTFIIGDNKRVIFTINNLAKLQVAKRLFSGLLFTTINLFCTIAHEITLVTWL